MAGTLEVHVVTPEREVWVGEASIVIARASDGDVGILPGHAPMVAALAVGPLFLDVDGRRVAAAVDGGFIHVVDAGERTRVDVLAENAELADELDSGSARPFQERASELRGEDRYDEARTEQAKADTRQRLSS
ncbi:MAG TPA: F0F1 ATP synthase subunit epsilon [Actinomycetes bacterium]|nr:F0F1 ATP synthase subunit epsilon [Actinomycetes bacterium]